MNKQKIWALALLGLVSLAGPFAEMLLTGRVDAYGKFELGEAFIALTLVFWWYHVDKAEQGYRAGPLMNGAMIVLLAIALPVYLLRSRGWKRGALATLAAAGAAAVSLGLGELGERLGALIV